MIYAALKPTIETTPSGLSEDVKSHVGLHTNADTRTKAQFQKDIYRRFVDQANRNITLELKTTEERENA